MNTPVKTAKSCTRYIPKPAIANPDLRAKQHIMNAKIAVIVRTKRAAQNPKATRSSRFQRNS